MLNSFFLSVLTFIPLLLQFLPAVRAANASEWRSRSIYQIIVDRYALPDGADPTACNTADQTWCGGTWNTISANLDYIQNAGFTAIWISPVSQNYQGERTPYGDPYHGYWIADASQLNEKFGTSDDLKALSDEIHSRGMYLMVDVVVNDVMALSTTPDYSTYLFKEEYIRLMLYRQSQYHPYCAIDWGNTTSEQTCWLGDSKVPLPDVKTEDPTVVSTYNKWIQQLVQEYDIDGLRIDGQHVDIEFWPGFCASAGVFCIGEVDDADASQAAPYQGKNSLDSILHYPMYNALTSAFTIPGPQNMSAVTDMINQSKALFSDPTVLGNFLENQDSMYNAMVFNFMSDGIPIVYYGQEQGFHGGSDPYNREPLWTSNYTKSTAYEMVTTLNQFRNFLVNTSDWATQQMEVLASTNGAIAINKANVLTVVTNVGSPPQNVSIPVYTKFDAAAILTEVLSCTQYSVGSEGAINVDYSKGGHPAIFVQQTALNGSGLCGNPGRAPPPQVGASTSGALPAANAGVARAMGMAAVTILLSGVLAFGF
ncbi:alpha-amylase [Phellopilus nigrolimitatus]|nr:alpha-amylase [Phellopilus nigrolimitatus]